MPKRFFLVIAISFHLLCIILFNTFSLLQSFALLHPKHPNKALHWVQENIHAFVNRPMIKLYSTYSGTEALFGFFAPRVGSQYITQFKLYDKTGKLISTQNGPTLRSQAGVLRYARLLDSLEPLVDPSNSKDSTRYDARYARAILYNLSMHIGHSQPQATKIVSRILLHHTAKPQHARDTAATSYKLVYQQQYAL